MQVQIKKKMQEIIPASLIIFPFFCDETPAFSPPFQKLMSFSGDSSK